MTAITPSMAAALADAVLAIHVGVVAFVVLGELSFLIGGWRGWRWVRRFGLRVIHVLLMLVVAAQAWMGALCPLTIWEQALRSHAGEVAFSGSFIEHWLSRLIFFDAPWWAFVAAYTGFALLVLLTWRWVPPQRGAAPRRPH
ncbi:MAG: DUF2784 domain-containing protein [Pseudomonadota bacterium]|nr:DUF2784 domain-containing protein [Pseudomonadota bacterium]